VLKKSVNFKNIEKINHNQLICIENLNLRYA
jgi:hypothetical protein